MQVIDQYVGCHDLTVINTCIPGMYYIYFVNWVFTLYLTKYQLLNTVLAFVTMINVKLKNIGRNINAMNMKFKAYS
jgi:hypothetical protein